MKKRLITLLIPLLLLSLAILPHTAQAKTLAPKMPLVLSTAQDTFNGTTYGSMAVFSISNPILSNTGDYFHERMLLTDNDPSGPSMEIGFQKVESATALDAVCNRTWSSPFLSYYYLVNDTNGNPHADCFAISSAQINTDTRFRIYTDSSSNPVVEFTNSSASYEKKVSVAGSFDPEYSQITYAETYSSTGSGHYIWGSDNSQNNWMNGNRNWQYQTDASGDHLSGCSGNGCPSTGGLEWYWLDGSYPHDTPQEGGILEMCGYASYGSYPECTVGS